VSVSPCGVLLLRRLCGERVHAVVTNPLIIAGLIVASGVSCGSQGERRDSSTPSYSLNEGTAALSQGAVRVPVVAGVARRGTLQLMSATTGIVRPSQILNVKSQLTGTVSRTFAVPGQRVRKGDVLVRLQPYAFELALREAQALESEANQRYLESYVPDSIVLKVVPSADMRAILATKAGLASASLRVERSRFDLARTIILSPFDGIVDAVHVTSGEHIPVGHALVTLVGTEQARIEAQVLDQNLSFLRVGSPAVVFVAGAPAAGIRGRIEAILPSIDTLTRTGRVLVRLMSPWPLRSGAYVDVSLGTERMLDRLLVPSASLIERDGRPLLFVVRSGRAQWTYVTPGRSDGTQTEILPDSSSGAIPVSDGDTVITSGQLTLTHDALVHVTSSRDGLRAASAPQ
jgi:RND family efflux transporter MFP subunit